MTPGARAQAAIELLGGILTAWASEKRIPADKMLEQYFKSHRYIGSKDRGGVAELVYWVLRHKATLEWWVAATPPDDGGRMLDAGENPPASESARTLIIAALILRGEHSVQSFDSLSRDSKYSPMPLSDKERDLCAPLAGRKLTNSDMPEPVRLNYPAWMEPLLHEAFGERLAAELAALNEQAPTDLRVNTLKTTREQLQRDLLAEGFDAYPTPVSPVGLRMDKRAPIFTSSPFKKGHFEMQDEASQLVALLCDTQPGYRIVDFCAGAGGKTLGLAAQMKNKGRILAWDVSENRLAQLAPRLKRAGVDNVQTHVLESEHDAFIKRHKATADRVLVDAPCSGSGTWRRNPDLKWRFSARDLQEVIQVQRSILDSAARLVKPGGRLIYATCSILPDENERQIESFLSENNHFRVVCPEKIWDKALPDGNAEAASASYMSVTPHQDGMDGFFAAVLERH